MLDNLGGSFGCLWRESAERSANRNAYRPPYARSVYSHPAPIIAFNTTEGWSRDMTADITDELRRRFAAYDGLPDSLEQLLEMARRLSLDKNSPHEQPHYQSSALFLRIPDNLAGVPHLSSLLLFE